MFDFSLGDYYKMVNFVGGNFCNVIKFGNLFVNFQIEEFILKDMNIVFIFDYVFLLLKLVLKKFDLFNNFLIIFFLVFKNLDVLEFFDVLNNVIDDKNFIEIVLRKFGVILIFFIFGSLDINNWLNILKYF